MIINGQRFYQPVDVTTTASGARGGPTSGLWEKSYSAGVPVSMLATAVKIMNNGKNHNNISGNYQQQSRRDAFSPPSFCAPSSVNNNPMASGQPQFQRKQQQQTSAAGFQRQRCNSFSPPPPHLPLLLQRSSMNGGGSLAKVLNY